VRSADSGCRERRNTSMVTGMTTRERADLCALIGRREKLAKSEASQRSAELLADFEQQPGSIHEYGQERTWKAVYA